MFVHHVLRHLMRQGFGPLERALDLCAAPGGKSTLLRNILPDECLLVCNEPLRPRAQVLAENMQKWGDRRVVVSRAFPSDFADFVEDFDLIITDVPCSGEGMFRKEPDAVTGWSPAAVQQCVERDRSILTDIWPCLRPGGILIYSTCTINPQEDEDNVDWICSHLGGVIVPIPVEAEWGIVGDLRKKTAQPESASDHPSPTLLPYCHLLPGVVRGEGFFVAAIRKNADIDVSEYKHLGPLPLDTITCLPLTWQDEAEQGHVDVDLGTAIRYLHGESLNLPADTPRGIVTICYEGQPLGPAKNIGNRANNLYPKEWRIRSGYIQAHSIVSQSR